MKASDDSFDTGTEHQKSSLRSVFLLFLRLGCTSFGGPVAHIGYFREEFVGRRRWLSEPIFAELLALCHFLPGPASSQMGFAIGLHRAGYAGALLAFLGFTLPSALFLIAVAVGFPHVHQYIPLGFIAGLKIVALAVVAQAIWQMAKNLCPDRWRLFIMLCACVTTALYSHVFITIVVLVLAGICSLISQPSLSAGGSDTNTLRYPPIFNATPIVLLIFFFLLLILLPIIAGLTKIPSLNIADVFYRTGALVFGGGHVVLPLLQDEVMQKGWMQQDVFLAGYGLTQAVPGPLFTFAGFLGASAELPGNPWLNGAIALLAIFLPSFLLLAGVLPFWNTLASKQSVRVALMGVNAAVVGLLLAAFYDPLFITSIHDERDFLLALCIFCALVFWRMPVWLAVLLGALLNTGFMILFG